jgi:hypothetical protein
MCLQFGFVFFLQKDFGAKAAHKMLVKLTPERFLSVPTLLPYQAGLGGNRKHR